MIDFRQQSIEIKACVLEHYLTPDVVGALLKKAPQETHMMDVLYSQHRFPCKSGVVSILKDACNARAAEYHSNPATSTGFEFLKLLADVHRTASLEAKRYVKRKVKEYSYTKTRDFTPLVTEISTFTTLRTYSPMAELSDDNGEADVRAPYKGDVWHVECASIYFGDLKRDEWTGLQTLFDLIMKKESICRKSASFTAWVIKDKKLLTQSREIRKAASQLIDFCSGLAAGHYELFASDLLEFKGLPSSSEKTLAEFAASLSTLDAGGSFHDPYTISSAASPTDRISWGIGIFCQLDIKGLLETCREIFRDKMEQHKARGNDNAVVLLNVDNFSSAKNIDTRSADAVNHVQDLKRSTDLVRLIAFTIARDSKSNWPICKGLIVVTGSAPFTLESGALVWPRTYFWHSPTGGDVAVEFPPLAPLFGRDILSDLQISASWTQR